MRLSDEKEFNAKVIGADPLSDIAVLQLETNEKFVPVKFGNSDKARIGDWVMAIGNPFGFGGSYFRNNFSEKSFVRFGQV